MAGCTAACGLGWRTTASAAVDWTSYGPEVGIGVVGCSVADTSAGSLSPPRGRIGSWVSVAANEARGAGSVNVTVESAPETLTPRRAAASVGSLAWEESANVSVAMTSAAVMGAPFDHSRFDLSTTVQASPLLLTAYDAARSVVGYPVLSSLSSDR